MKTRIIAIAAVFGFLGAASIIGPSRLLAQALPGPLSQPQSQGSPVPPRTKPKRQEPQPRTTLAGAWKLNRDDSDDPRRKMQDARSANGGSPGGYPRGRGRTGVGFPFPGSGGGMGGGPPRGQGNGGGQDPENNPKLQQMIQPAEYLTIGLKIAEVDVAEDQYRKLVFYTDGRQLQKPTDENYQEIAAHWDGNHLVSDEKGPQNGKMSRTFELSQDGRQFYETLRIENSRSKTPLIIRYAYDLASPETQSGHESDPDQPVMKRRADDSNSSSQ